MAVLWSRAANQVCARVAPVLDGLRRSRRSRADLGGEAGTGMTAKWRRYLRFWRPDVGADVGR